jgi:hypothetical protein
MVPMSIKTGVANDFLDGLKPSKKSRKRKIKYWPKRHKLCRNCGCDSDRRDYGGNGYCCRCYRLTRRLEAVRHWVKSRSETLKYIPLSGNGKLITDRLTDEEFEIFKDECASQLEGHLRRLQVREHRFRGNVDGLDVEQQLGRILRLIVPKASYPRNDDSIDASFTKDQLGKVYRLLDVIEEAIPWEGPGRYRTIEEWKAWDKISEFRTQSGPVAPVLD